MDAEHPDTTLNSREDEMLQQALLLADPESPNAPPENRDSPEGKTDKPASLPSSPAPHVQPQTGDVVTSTVPPALKLDKVPGNIVSGLNTVESERRRTSEKAASTSQHPPTSHRHHSPPSTPSTGRRRSAMKAAGANGAERPLSAGKSFHFANQVSSADLPPSQLHRGHQEYHEAQPHHIFDESPDMSHPSLAPEVAQDLESRLDTIKEQLKELMLCPHVPDGLTLFMSGRVAEAMAIPAMQDGLVTPFLEEQLALELQLQPKVMCYNTALRLCQLYNAVGRLWTDQDRDVGMALQLLRKALLMCHPRSGLLALDPEACLLQRIITLNNLACCARQNRKANLGLKYANQAIKCHHKARHDRHPTMQVMYCRSLLNCCACLSRILRHEAALKAARQAVAILMQPFGVSVDPDFHKVSIQRLHEVIDRLGKAATDDIAAHLQAQHEAEQRLKLAAVALYNMAVEHEHLCQAERAGSFFKCAAFVAEEILGPDAPLSRQLSKQCMAFFMKGVGQVPHWFVGRPATARLGMPNARSGFSYATVHKTHAKPDLAKPVPGPFLAAQFAFLPTRNALWNKPVSFNANTFLQRETATYASTEPRFDRYLTLDGGMRLPPWKQQVAEGTPLLVNVVRPPQLFGSVSEELIGVGKPCGPVYPVISELQNKRSSTARSMPRSAAGRRRAHPMACKPWRSMVENEDDATISEMSMLSAREDRIQRLAADAQAFTRKAERAEAMRAAYLEGSHGPKRGSSAPVGALDKTGGAGGGSSRMSKQTSARKLERGSPVLALL